MSCGRDGISWACVRKCPNTSPNASFTAVGTDVEPVCAVRVKRDSSSSLISCRPAVDVRTYSALSSLSIGFNRACRESIDSESFEKWEENEKRRYAFFDPVNMSDLVRSEA